MDSSRSHADPNHKDPKGTNNLLCLLRAFMVIATGDSILDFKDGKGVEGVNALRCCSQNSSDSELVVYQIRFEG